MIVLSAGMEKSGTGWYFNLTNDLLVAAGHQDIRVVREKFRLHGILKYYNCNMQQPAFRKFARLLIPHILGNTFVVKTHGSPSSKALRYLMSVRVLKASYIYRDPRDVVISAFEHGEKIRASGQIFSFGKLDSVEASILRVRKLLKIWDEWERCSHMFVNNMLLVKYEDLVTNPLKELRRLADFLGIDVSPKILLEIEKRYIVDSARVDLKGLHFNKGVTGRFRHLMNQKEQYLCREHFGSYLQKMGYPE